MGVHTWTCPACGRSVPLRVSACHCGMTREQAEARAAAEAEASLEAATAAALPPRRATIRGPALTWGSLPADVKALLGGVALVVLVGLGFLVFGPHPKPIVPVLGYVDAGPPPAPRPTPRPTPPFKLPWWR
jgi:hypothetical protein